MRYGRILALAVVFVFTGVVCAADTAKAEESYIKVEVKGKVKTGIVAIGGEATGTTITTKNGVKLPRKLIPKLS